MDVTKIGSPKTQNIVELGKNTIDSKSKGEEIKLSNGNRFNEFMVNIMNDVNQKHVDANKDVEALIKGEDITMHEIMISAQEAQMSMQLLIECRNKIYDAYQQMNNVQI